MQDVIETLKKAFNQNEKYLNLLGISIGLIGLGFVVNRLLAYKDQLNWSNLNERTITITIGMTVVYGCANFILALAWRSILLHLGVTISPVQAIQIYGKSQLAKYVPGNVFQFAGRQALGVANSLPNRPLAVSILWELGWLVISGGIFFFLAVSLITSFVSFIISIILFFILLAALIWVAWRFFSTQIAQAAISYVIFHIIAACAFTIVLVSIVGPSEIVQFPNTIKVAGGYIIAWLFGVITPGVPGGVGVREIVLFWFLNGAITPGDLLISIILSRIVTIGGDVLFFLVSFFWK